MTRIDSEQGWQAYLRAKNACDERRSARPDLPEQQQDQRAREDDETLDEFRREWLTLLAENKRGRADEPQSRLLPLSLLLVSVAVIGILLLMLQPA